MSKEIEWTEEIEKEAEALLAGNHENWTARREIRREHRMPLILAKLRPGTHFDVYSLVEFMQGWSTVDVYSHPPGSYNAINWMARRRATAALEGSLPAGMPRLSLEEAIHLLQDQKVIEVTPDTPDDSGRVWKWELKLKGSIDAELSVLHPFPARSSRFTQIAEMAVRETARRDAAAQSPS